MAAWPVRLLLTILAACGPGFFLRRLHVPGGLLLGAVIGVSTLNLVTGLAFLPANVKVLSQIVVGAFLGCTMTREHVRGLPQFWKPILCVLCGYLAMALTLGTVICHISHVDLLTALFCVSPGGLSDTPLIAMDFGATVTYVVALQMLRVIYGLAVVPSLISWSDRVLGPRLGLAYPYERSAQRMQKAKKHYPRCAVFVTLAVAAAGGLLGKISNFPAGTLLFALIFSLGLKVNWDKAHMPMQIRRGAQILSGSCIGLQIRAEELQAIRQMAIPALLMLLAYSAVCLGVGILIAKRFHLRLCEGMLCLAPASPSEMALIAEDMHVSNPNLTAVQICRQVAATALFPQIFLLYVHMLQIVI